MNMLRKTMGAVAMGAVLIVPAMSTTAFAAPASEQQATANLVKQLSTIKSMTAGFEQTTKATAGQRQQARSRTLSPQHMNQTFKGVMKVARPGKFYWQTTTPAKQTIVTSGRTVWIYDPDLQQAVRQSLDEQVANTPALLLSGNTAQIMKTYRISMPDASKTSYTLYPKQKDSAFQSLSISFGAKNVPTSMVLNDSLGQTTTVRFNNVKMNTAIPDATFNFVPPKGTDIIDQ